MNDNRIDLEGARVATLRSYGILDSAPEADFNDIVHLASEICGAPVSLISLVEHDRQWFKAASGFDLPETPIEMSICAHALAQNDYLEIENTLLDERTSQNPLVTGEEHVRFYAGALLRNEDGIGIGTLCVLDRQARQLSDFQRRALSVLADQVMRQIELRKVVADADILRREVDHRVKNSLQAIEALIRLQVRHEPSQAARNALETVQGRLSTVSSLHEALYRADTGAAVALVPFLDRVVQAGAAQLPAGVSLDCHVEPVSLPSRDASSVGMILNEAMSNAAKYAYLDREGGLLSVKGRAEGSDYVLVCCDDGPGTVMKHPDSTGLGTRIMQAAAQQLQGAIEIASDKMGHCVTLRWPIGDP